MTADVRTDPAPEADCVGRLEPGDLLRATGRTAPGEGGWIEREDGGWVSAARVDRPPAEISGDLPVGREGLAAGRVLPDDWAPSDLVVIPDSLEAAGYEGRRMRLRAGALEAFRRMITAAAEDSVTIRILSAWRSSRTQRKLYRRAVERNEAQTLSAAPGRSEHQLGTTADVSTPAARPLHPELDRTPAGRWIRRRAAEFGIVVTFSKSRHEARGVAWEPWHLRWVGDAVEREDGW
jgi:hypothetical protein